ncbi:hypothetical protein N7493_011919 [Penicillium malachiteum]|uniref:non-specific serine/threonine protein kinase n=1 Tax=Penicillium malachiteum TaxID=1324776 RepID=A0AAD6MPZ8_9EURO|nr:hypothetical protein N7493_011919 [Penicillium malachiteum]
MAPLLKLFSAQQRRSLATFGRKPLWRFPTRRKLALPQHELIDEEKIPRYNSDVFYPAKQGQVLGDKYQLVLKVGFGRNSTVWFARDLNRFERQPESVVAMKIINSNLFAKAHEEKKLENYLLLKNPRHYGYLNVRHCLDAVDVTGPGGRHKCLVYEPMRDPMWLCQEHFVGSILPYGLAKIYIRELLAGLDYLHSECNVVHGNLTLDNILMSFENDEILPYVMERQTRISYKVDADGRTVYLSHGNYGAIVPKDLHNMVPKIANFGQGLRMLKQVDGVPLGIYPIQPMQYRAPEVILGCDWDVKADIWNFGAMLWNVLGREALFQKAEDKHGQYDAKAHLGEMIALLGPPPAELISKSKLMAKNFWPKPVCDDNGKVFHSAEEFFGGPFFDEEGKFIDSICGIHVSNTNCAQGKFLYGGLIPDRTLEDSVPFIPKSEREDFLSFVREMLVWLPEERSSASELMEHPFLDDV